MPYQSLKALPKSVKHVLPHHAQEIYLKSYNNARKQYWFKSKRRDPEESLEAICHKVAWSAVEQTYYKNNDGNWILKKK